VYSRHPALSLFLYLNSHEPALSSSMRSSRWALCSIPRTVKYLYKQSLSFHCTLIQTGLRNSEIQIIEMFGDQTGTASTKRRPFLL